MADSTTDVSSPEYFQSRFGVDRATAESFSQQAAAIDSGRGAGHMAEAPPLSAPTSLLGPSQARVSARAEYDALMADRRSGKINNAQWSNGGQQREQELANLIAEGHGARPAPATPAPSDDPMAAHFAPPADASEYQLPYGGREPTDDDIAADRQLKSDLYAAEIPKSTAEAILTSVRNNSRAYANETAAQTEARLADTKTRATSMWAREGISWGTAMHTIETEVMRWPEVLQAQFVRNVRLLGPLDLDRLLQFARYRNRAARR
jgi:hypothetical protein